jgi:hypothetical protein
MPPYNPHPQPPVRRDLTDPRSSAGAPDRGGRKAILNDARSTRGRPS